MNNIDIQDSRLFDYLAEKAEQEADEEEFCIYDVDSAWKEELERWRD